MEKYTPVIKRRAILSGLALLGFLSAGAQEKAPNIIMILSDDLGYSDLSCYGSEIRTPSIDKLAEEGLRFSRYYVSPMCVTSRVALLSGMEFKAAGGESFPNGVSFAHLLRDAGYATSMVGKNHGMNNFLIGSPDTDYGFDHFFGFTGGELNSFTGEGNVEWQTDGRIFPYTDLPEDFYTTKNFTDSAIVFMKNALDSGKPFFSYVAHNAPHTPLHAPERNVRKYYDPGNGIKTFEDGWEKLRTERLERMKKMGLLSSGVELSFPGVEIPDWDLLPDTSLNYWELQKEFEMLARAAFAGMVDNIDENVGKIIAFLDDPNEDGNRDDSQLNNTIIIFTSDNGGCYAGLYTERDDMPWDKTTPAFTNNYGWGTLSNTPYRYYKHGSHEGSIRSPLIIHWPDGISLPEGTILHQMVRIWDLYPTFLELAGASYPENPKQKNLKPLMGESLVPLFSDRDYKTEEFFVSEFSRSQGIIKGNWKIANYYDGPFELFNLEEDPTERRDLASEEPEIYTEFLQLWDEYTREHDFADDKQWNIPAGNVKRGWGYEFKVGGFEASTPENMSENVPLDVKLSLEISGEVSFSNTEGKVIRLQKYGDPRILWSADPDESHPSQGKKIITFKDFPALEPGGHYYITWDEGWFHYLNGGSYKPIMPVRECAWSYRFKTIN